MKKTTVLTIVLALVILILGISTAVLSSRVAGAKETCTAYAYGAIRELERELETAISLGEYTAKRSEAIGYYLGQLKGAIAIANKFDQSWKAINTSGLDDIAKALGTWTMQINNITVEGVLYDGEVSEDELAFIEALLEDVKAMRAPLLGEDGLNRRGDLKWNDVRAVLQPFCKKWDEWTPWSEDVPWALLNQ